MYICVCVCINIYKYSWHFEQHMFELCRPNYMGIFFNKCKANSPYLQIQNPQMQKPWIWRGNYGICAPSDFVTHGGTWSQSSVEATWQLAFCDPRHGIWTFPLNFGSITLKRHQTSSLFWKRQIYFVNSKEYWSGQCLPQRLGPQIIHNEV